MKKKLHTTFWALGILVLLLSQLLVLAPTQRASAAQLTLQSITDQTYKFSVFAAMYSCLNKINTSSNYAGPKDFGWGTVIVGFAGSDGGNNDGEVSCDEAGKLWMGVAGHPDVADMMSKVGFTKGGQSCNATGPTATSCTDAWKTSNKATTLRTFTNFAQSKSIPTSAPTWHRYILAVTALDAKCSDGGTITTTTGAQASATSTVKVVKDDGTLVDKIYRTGADSYAAWPTLTGGDKSSCKYLVDEIKKPTTGANALAGALAQARINATITAAKTAICDQLDLKTQKEKDKCLTDMAGYMKTCIDQYYSGSASPTAGTKSRAEPFDVDNVAACVETKAKKGGYDITAETIAGFLTSAQDANTPEESDTSTTTDDPCSVLAPGEMRWLACALLTAGSGIAETFYAIIQSLLYTPVAQTFKSIDTPFKTFRLLGMGLIVITGLIMIIAQATGSDLVDAYTVKKVLPKLGVALIGIALSLPLLRFAIELTNNIGFLLGDFIANAGGAQNLVIPASGSDGVGATLVALVGLTIAGVGAFVYGLSVISFILILAIGLLVGVVTLALRQTAIVVLVLIAPLAIASYVLPGTDKLWKFWKNTFLTTLLMFPIIMLFIKSGVLMAGIFGSNGDGGFSQLMAVLVYFAPYFMLPMAFKMAGGLMGNVFGMLNDRMKGAYNGLRSWRSNTRKRRVADYLTEKKNGPKIFGKDIIGEGIRRAATMYEGSMSLNPERQKAYRKYRQKLVNDDAIKGVQADNGLSTGNTAATDIARTANNGAEFDKRFTDNYIAAQQEKDLKKPEGERRSLEQLTREGTAKARLARSELEGSLETTMGSTRMKAAARHAYGVTDNTAFWKEGENMPDLDDFYGSYGRQIDEGIISEGQAVTETGANKMRPDSTKLSSGQRLQAVQWTQENAAAGRGYTFTPKQLETVRAWASAGISADEAVLANPRAAKATATTLDAGLRSVYEGTDLAIDEEGKEAKEKFIADRIPVLIEKSRRAGVAIDDTRARAEAEQAYKNQVGLEQVAKIAAIADGIGRGIPEVQAILSRGLLGQEVDLKTMDRDFALSIGITDKEINSGKFMTHLEIAKRATPYIQTLHKDYLSGNEELGAKASGITAEGGAASGPTPAAIGGGSS